MPLALAITRDGNTIATGHIDGGVMLWDVRQCRAGAVAPLREWRDQAQPVCAIASMPQVHAIFCDQRCEVHDPVNKFPCRAG